jgi:hypothetical protein
MLLFPPQSRFYTLGTYILDTYSGAVAAYGLRKLRNNYTGYCITVRRSSDNAEQDIGFSSGTLDTSTLTTFVGANDGYIVTWYDQSGNARDITQSTASAQPQIVNSGSVLTTNSKPAIKFNSDYLAGSFGTDLTQPTTIVLLATADSVTSSENYLLDGNDGTGVKRHYLRFLPSGGSTYYGIGSTTSRLSTATQTTDQNLYFTNYNTPSSTLHINGSPIINADAGNAQLSGLTVGASYAGVQGFVGTAQEAIVWNTNQASNRSNIESDLNTYYSIY